MKAIVEPTQRYAKMRAHTATHLLHAAIATFLPTTKQAGSLVDQDYCRFDFASDNLFSLAQLTEIENLVTARIKKSMTVKTSTHSFDDAVALGAKAFFEDKYDSEVRVVTIADVIHMPTSIELCGGTHVANTAHIGAFKIIEHSSVASGVKRIVAQTGPLVGEYAAHLQERLHAIAARLAAKPAHIEQKIDKLVKTQKDLTDQVSRLQEGQIMSSLQTAGIPHVLFDVVIDLAKHQALSHFPFKTIVQKAKTYFTDQKVCIISPDGSFALIGQGAKSFAQEHNLRGGGSDMFVQGKDLIIRDILS